MKFKKTIIIIFLFFELLARQSVAQNNLFYFNDAKAIYGLSLGYNQAMISGLTTTILSEPYFLHYTLTAQSQKGLQAGFFVESKLANSPLSFDFEAGYSRQATNLYFNNTQENFYYNMLFKYNYVNLLVLFRYYPFLSQNIGAGDRYFKIHIGAGPQVGFNATPSNITYKSGGAGYQPAFGTDLEQQQQLRNVLNGKTDAGGTVELGYFFGSYIDLNLRYHLGFTDVVQTQTNSYNFIENNNIMHVWEINLKVNFSKFFEH